MVSDTKVSLTRPPGAASEPAASAPRDRSWTPHPPGPSDELLPPAERPRSEREFPVGDFESPPTARGIGPLPEGESSAPPEFGLELGLDGGLDGRLDDAPELEQDTPRFLTQEEIARGGMGRVWRAFDQVLQRPVALKRVHGALAANNPELIARFVDEARITGQLDHPNIVPVHDLQARPDGPRLVMKLIEGETLTTYIERLHQEQFDLEQAEAVLKIFSKVCDAVAFAHSRGVLHRDIKPDNVMVGTFGQVYLMDWGLALQIVPTLDARESGEFLRRSTFPPSIVGTPEFMAPEQARGDLVDERTDVFGLGGILYFLLTGRGPNAGDAPHRVLAQAQSSRPRDPEGHLVWDCVPPSLVAITKKAIAPAPEDRFPSANALKAAVEDFLRGGGWFPVRRFEPGEAIVTEGERGDSAYIIVRGECEVFKTLPDGARTVLRRMGAGDVFGETALLTGETRSASVVALGEVEVQVVTEKTLRLELQHNRWLGAFVVALAERFREKDAELTELESQSTPSPAAPEG